MPMTKEQKAAYDKTYSVKNRKRINDRNRARNATRRDDQRAYARAYYRSVTPEQRRNWHLHKRYGITLEQFERMVVRQEARCACCGDQLKLERSRSVHVDHDHQTNAIRGIVCNGCNTALGRFGDDVAGLTRALVYVSGGSTSVELVDEHY